MKRLAWIIAIGACIVSAAPARSPQTHVIQVENMEFHPPSLTVARGDRITWVNKDLFPHTATADSHEFDSQQIAPQASWTYVAEKLGDYPYVCTYHRTMKARVIVR